MRSLLPILALAGLATAIPVVPREAPEFVGRGQIHVIRSDSLAKASPDQRIGCLNAAGQLTLFDCAIFSKIDTTYPRTVTGLLSSPAGDCSFTNKAMPTNKDSVYGKNSHAWSCGVDNNAATSGEVYYTVNGFKYPFLCNGNLNCFYDIPVPPASPDDDGAAIVPVWQFFWGGSQMGITPGHVQTMWLWVPTLTVGFDI